MTALTERIDRARAERRQVDIRKAVLTLLALLPFVLGWTAGAVWSGLVWAYYAGLTGWTVGRQQTGGAPGART